MAFLVTALKPTTTAVGSAHEVRTFHDTDKDARSQAESFLRSGHTEVAVWQQLATPRIEQVVKWD